MLLEHIRFSFSVELASDCHIGDGEEAELPHLRPNAIDQRPAEDQQGPIRVATITRNFHGKPYLPATALKGALRKRLGAHLDKTTIERMFGEIKKSNDGAMGRFAFYSGEWREKLNRDAADLPHWNDREGTCIATHVAISRRTGAAEHMKLFNQEMLPAGTVFEVSGVWFGTLEEAKAELPVLLSPLASKEGLNIGSGQKLGNGALRFFAAKDQVRLKQTRFVPETGAVEENVAKGSLTIQATKSAQARVDLHLHCEGPFISVDTARDKTKHHNYRANRIMALKRNEQTPVLHASTLAGALRARAAWLSECEGMGGDDRFRKPATWKHPKELTPVERLFGVGGWRGLVRFSQPESAGAKGYGKTLTSIAIDRFSGAVLDSTLFEHEIFTGVDLNVSVILETRKDRDGLSFPTPEDRQLLVKLLGELDNDTLMLGHATNRGFGWFNVRASGLNELKENG